nr:hypothetical protein [Tanacetum cinerariifolium]
MGDRRSKEDVVLNISTSIFVTNFPDQTNAKELWSLCNQYGNVIDAFIPNRISKVGKRFGFIRFIKTYDVERLVNNLCTIWIGKHKLHANIARFNRPPLNKGGYSSNVKANSKSAHVVNSNRNGISGPHNSYIQAAKAATYSHSEVKVSKPALVLDKSCLHEHDLALSLIGKLKEFGSLPNLNRGLMEKGFTDINIRYMGGFWALLQFSSKISKENFMSYVGVNSWFSKIDQASNSFYVDERVVWIEIEGVPLCAWSHNTFSRISSTWGTLLYDEDDDMHDEESESDVESVDSKIYNFLKDELSEIESVTEEIPETVFDEAKHAEFKSSTSDEIHNEAHKDDISEDLFNIYAILNKEKPATSAVQHTEGEPQYPPGFTPCDRSKVNSNLEQCSFGGVGQAKGSPRKENASMASHKENVNASGCSGSFQKVCTPKSGGSMLQVIEDLIKVGHTMGYKMEGGLMEVPTGGFESFMGDAWCNISITESNAMFRMTLKLKILKGLIRGWVKGKKDKALVLKKEWKNKLSDIDSSIDKGKTSSTILEERMAIMNNLSSLEKMESIELAQKAKVKWSIEGDENSKFFHGIINKRWNNLAIRGIVVDGVWIEDPIVVKNEFLSHFQNMFNAPREDPFVLDMDFPNRLSLDQAQDLEKVFSKEEIKDAVWDCGLDKSPVPNGYTFGFYRRFWSLIESEVVDAVNHFFQNGFCHKGGNSSFIALIAKTQGAKMVKDFRPISLIGSIYKIFTKLLTNRLVTVIDGLVNEETNYDFKVDFEKAFDSVRWDFLDDVLKNFGFGSCSGATVNWNRPAFYDDDDDDDVDYTIAITPVLSTEEPDNSLSMGDEHLDTIPAMELDEDDNLREKLLNVHLLIANIEALKDNPAPSFEFLTKSSSTYPKSFLEETNTFENSLPEFENFYFDLEEISSGSTTTHSDISLSDYEAFFGDNHIKEISSGSTTTDSDISLSEYDSYIFDLSNDQFSPTDMSDFTHEEFADELTHIISPPEYDRFYFRNLPNPGELISILNSGIHENLSSTTRVNLPVEDNHSHLLVYVVWIFLVYLTYPVIPPYLHSFENEDTIFDPCITINRFYSFKPGLSHRCETFKKFNTHRSHLNESPMEIIPRNLKTLAKGFYPPSLHFLSFNWESSLKQGDPLSPSLFILVMESLHLSFQNIVDAGLFKGVALNDSLKISHLFYTDDVVFIGQWCELNIATIIRVLYCFYRALGLHINLHKSKLLGLAVKNDLVNLAANSIGCMTLSLPFSYLGVNIGGHMSRISSLDVVIDNVRKRLSKWKMKVLSVRGRLTLLKSVRVPMHVINKLESIRSHFFNGVDPNVRNTSFTKWDNVLASKEKGGLCVSSFFALNRALIFKWVWHFRSQSNSLWSRVIKALHGEDGNEANTMFWQETLKGEAPFKIHFPRLFALESNKRITVEEKIKQPGLVSSFHRNPRGGIEQVQMDALSIILEDLILPNMKDRWSWSLSGDGEFFVSSARSFIDAKTLGTVGSKTQWYKYVPIKINILSWRVKLNNLPTRLNLSRRGMDLQSIFCSSCNHALEYTNHIFFDCSMMKELYKCIARWWNLYMADVSSYEDWWSWFSSLRLSPILKKLLEGFFTFLGQEPGIYKEGQMSQCASCYGRGLIAHRDGSDTICVKCNGKGKIPCATCGSRGLVKCLKCEGSGSLLTRKIAVVKWNTHSTRKLNATSGAASVPDDVFHRAKGVQLCNTQAYHCTPAFFADSFFLNQFSSEVISERPAIPPTARVICERHTISVIPVTRVTMVQRGQSFSFYIIGFSRDVYLKDYYPSRFCWGCCPCLDWLKI